ncbi:hypothetical protein JKA74_11350 [Marivirga sp. S37H4]|uniref:Uncharacterized protein n=1 Tax=Marivirga aurantiaca TaxID=2802615 RepID=A0A934WZF0_9BACT|nr:hypothetical protein [Marivirga aurantiaca]MBK6265635.1 hypothetical protein [Marivirga aurantiaca]
MSSQRLILNSALAGLIIIAASFLFRFFVETVFPNLFLKVSEFLGSLFSGSQKYLWTMLIGLFLTIIITHLTNFIISKIPRIRNLPINLAITYYGNELEQLCRDSIVQGFALQITLKNDKVYVGFISEAPIPSKTNYLLFTPVYSGYRDSLTKRLNLDTSYALVIESLIEDNLEEKLSIISVVIKQDEILTISPHDPDIYSRFSGKI